MNKNTRRARAIAIAQDKPDAKLLAIRYLMLAVGASTAAVALLIAHAF